MFKYIITILLLLGIFEAWSQSIDVKNFRWLDNNGQRKGMPIKTDTLLKKCAVIKVITPQIGFDFDFGKVGKALATQQEKGAIWLWVPAGAKMISISNKQVDASYSYPFAKELEEEEVYAIELKMGDKKITGNKQVFTKWITINCQPLNAILYIDDYPAGITPFYGSLTQGQHKLRMELKNKKKKKTITVSDKTEYPFSVSFKMNPFPKNRTGDELFVDFESNPEFPGGFDKMLKFIYDNLQFPDNGADVQGTVYVQFLVSETGKISNAKILHGIGGGCDEEAIRIVKMMPKWVPGRLFGAAIPVLYQIPVKFQQTIN